jgi:hypothetical protein
MSSITTWNRVEPRCRTQDLQSGLEARVHDPLWLLARQWQMGEFEGLDAGSPVSVTATATAAPFDRYATASDPGKAYDGQAPIETLIEREPIRPATAQTDLFQAAEAGRQFFRLLDAAGLSSLRPTYLTAYPLSPVSSSDQTLSDLSSIVSGRLIDGVKLHSDIVQAGTNLPPQPAIASTQTQAVLTVTQSFRTWYESLFSEPTGSDAWLPARMEYSFTVGAMGDTGSLTAKEYDGSGVDWYTFDRSTTALSGGSSTAPTPFTRTSMPAPVTFRGMPARRFWEMEDAAVNIGALTASATDLGRLLLREFALIYGNDWFQIPIAVPIGSQVSLQSLVVSDTFGITTTIPHYIDADNSAGLWKMFALSSGAAATDLLSAKLLVVPPSAAATQESSDLEDVLLMRDEIANLGWGVENIVTGPSGSPIDRSLAIKTAATPAPPPNPDAVPRYLLGTSVPDNWVPFIPVEVDQGPLQLRRGTLPLSQNAPLGRLLSYPGLTMFLEELPREGTHLERLYRFARGVDGSTWVWVGRRRSVGKGEGRSGLEFDSITH